MKNRLLIRSTVLLLVFLFLPASKNSLPDSFAGKQKPPEVVVCETHDRALYYWLTAAEKGLIPASGNTVIHIDAHPDMGVPECPISADRPLNIENLLSCVDISSFQLAAVGAGLVKKIVWLRPSWAKQFSDGQYRFHLGEVEGGDLKVDDKNDYYVVDGLWAPLDELKNPVEIEFQVLKLDQAKSELQQIPGPVILDIDLDLFSTRNPGLDFFRRAGFADAEIKEIVARFSPEQLWLSKDQQKRAKDIDAIKEGITTLMEGPWYSAIGAIPGLFARGVGPLDLYKVYTVVSKLGPEVSMADIIVNFELAIGLPEHRASSVEIHNSLQVIKNLIAANIIQPVLITVARSVRGGFTPPDVGTQVEKHLLNGLREVLGDFILRYDKNCIPAAGQDRT